VTSFELLYLCAEPFVPPLQRQVRAKLKHIAASSGKRMDILDVGGRYSNYTIGVPANITVTDLPRNTPVQESLHLGTTNSMMERLLRRRSNVKSVRYDDMTHSNLPDATYDCVVAVEVLEHTDEDEAFVAEVKRVLKPGCLFLMTTPNGEFVKNHNPDHRRHYTRKQLTDILSLHFNTVHVEYAVKGTAFYALALRSWSLRHPLRTLVTMVSGCISAIESSSENVRSKNIGTHQLVAWASNEEKKR
jgi:SAM-dependent methyltransferase